MARFTAPRMGNLTALLIAVALCAGVTLTLFAGHEELAGTARAPMPVLATRYTESDGYTLEQRFLGTVQAATRTDIGFEVPGSIAQISVRAGDPVDAGSVLARLDTRALSAQRDAATANALQLAAELELARARTRRQQPLSETGAISEQDYDDTRLREKALSAQHRAAQARLSALEIELEKSVLRAPYRAVVGERFLDEGAVTQPGLPVVTLVASGRREAHVGVSVEQARRLQPGTRHTLRLGERPVVATLRALRPDLDPVTMTTTAIFDLPENVPAFDGEPLSISLPRQIPGRGGWLPLSALLEGERGVWTVLALEDDGSGAQRTRREAVEVLHVSGERAYVRGTLRDGERVVADGVHRIAPGTRIRVSGN